MDKTSNGFTFTASADIKMTPELQAFMDGMNKEYEDKQKEVKAIMQKFVDDFMNNNNELFTNLAKEDAEFADGLARSYIDCIEYAFSGGWNECYKYHKDILEKDLN